MGSAADTHVIYTVEGAVVTNSLYNVLQLSGETPSQCFHWHFHYRQHCFICLLMKDICVIMRESFTVFPQLHPHQLSPEAQKALRKTAISFFCCCTFGNFTQWVRISGQTPYFPCFRRETSGELENDFSEWVVSRTHMQVSVHREAKLLSEGIPGVVPLSLHLDCFPAFIRYLQKCLCVMLWLPIDAPWDTKKPGPCSQILYPYSGTAHGDYIWGN